MKSFIILCGGMSRRMGSDKGSMDLHGKPMIIHIIETINPIADEIVLVLRDDDQLEVYKKIIDEHKLSNKYDLKICTDIIKDQGPLAGILTGLLQINSDKAMVIPCDSPFVTEQFINRMFELSEKSDYDAFVPKWSDKRLEPLHSIYKKDIHPLIQKLLKNNTRDVKTLLTRLNVKYIDTESLDTSGESFYNLNQQGDITRFNDKDDL
jgi:molybdopterin-guanine dinucleotide biosynthesis protein A